MNMFDTHCHLNFKAFRKDLPLVIDRAKAVGVNHFVVPGTDIETSKKAVEIAEKFDGVYAAVGIHPHHVFRVKDESVKNISRAQNIFTSSSFMEIEALLSHPKVVAVGEVGMDKFQYTNTKYQTYVIDENFVNLQKEILAEQIKLAIKYKKSLILHNRNAWGDLLEILERNWDNKLSGRTVFHCMESDFRAGITPPLQFAIDNHIYIGVDGDVTYSKEKQAFVKKIPLELLVLETDSPLLLPEPLRSKKLYPNEPKNIPIILDCISQLRKESREKIEAATTENAKKLFNCF
jgi:TatD DNase family protein